jgi:hypothetical protein
MGMVYDQTLVVIARESFDWFAVCQSRTHETWVRAFSATLEDRLRYIPSDCFQTFPFPSSLGKEGTLQETGRACLDMRSELMRLDSQGLTDIYNRLHNQRETSAEIIHLRQLHAEMDRAVLRTYGWDDLAERAEPQFLDETNEDDHKYQGRLFWPAAFRDEVLACLLTLNAERAAAERENDRLAPRPRAKRAQRGLDEAKLLEIAVADEDD